MIIMGLTPKQSMDESKLSYEQIDQQLKNIIKRAGQSTTFSVSDLSMSVDELILEAKKNGYTVDLIENGKFVEFH